MKRSFDVVVSGLGPAGAGAGVELVRAGAKVLILDGASPPAKACGGCISRRWFWLIEWLGAPEWFGDHPVSGLVLAKKGAENIKWTTARPAATLVDRGEFDRHLAARAVQEGAKVLKARLQRFDKTESGFHIHTSAGSFKADWLLGADGASGLVARRLGIRRSGFIYAAVAQEKPLSAKARSYLPPGFALIELGAAPGGYGWIFVREGQANLGVGSWQRKKLKKRDGLLSCFRSFAERHGFSPMGPYRGAAIPCSDGRPTRLNQGRALVAGDAASMSDPFLGEGIGQAMLSGRLAAQAIIAGNPDNYMAKMARGMIVEHRHARLLARLIHNFPRFVHGLAALRPSALETGFRLLRGETTHQGLWRNIAARIMRMEPPLDHSQEGNYYKILNCGP